MNILREDWKPVLNLNSIMVGLQYLFLEPNPSDPLNKGPSVRVHSPPLVLMTLVPSRTEAAEDMLKNRDGFVNNVKQSMRGATIKGVVYDRVLVQ